MRSGHPTTTMGSSFLCLRFSHGHCPPGIYLWKEFAPCMTDSLLKINRTTLDSTTMTSESPVSDLYATISAASTTSSTSNRCNKPLVCLANGPSAPTRSTSDLVSTGRNPSVSISPPSWLLAIAPLVCYLSALFFYLLFVICYLLFVILCGVNIYLL